jgi:pyrroline-5-carboxylate reductase
MGSPKRLYFHAMNLGFIGVGKIAAAVVEGLCTSKVAGPDIFLSPRNEATSTALASRFPKVQRLTSNQAVLDQCDTVIISVRPGMAPEVLKALRFRPDHTVISVIALLRYADLSALVTPAINVCRAIPLPTVVQHNCPIPLFRADAPVTRLFASLGETFAVGDEEQLHAIWTLSGLITPFYELLGLLAGWTAQHGVDREIADAYTSEMFESLAFAAARSRPIDFAELSHHAATPGGMNEQAGREIRETGAHQAWTEAADRLLSRFSAPIHHR